MEYAKFGVSDYMTIFLKQLKYRTDVYRYNEKYNCHDNYNRQ